MQGASEITDSCKDTSILYSSFWSSKHKQGGM